MDGIPCAPGSVYVGMIVSDNDIDMPNFSLGFSALDRLQLWLREMEPHAAAVLCGDDEDAHALQVLILERADDSALH